MRRMDVLVAVRIVASVRGSWYAAKWRSPLKGDRVFAQELKLSDKWGLQTALLVCPAASAAGAVPFWVGRRARGPGGGAPRWGTVPPPRSAPGGGARRGS